MVLTASARTRFAHNGKAGMEPAFVVRSPENQMWMDSPEAAAAASMTASPSVGCGWMVAWTSSIVASSVMARLYSEMSSVASARS